MPIQHSIQIRGKHLLGRPLQRRKATAVKAAASPREVLIVDDNDDLRELLHLCLEGHGFQVSTASDGVEALDRIGRGPRPALILLDLMMPRMDGWEVLKKLEADAELRSIPVAVMSAHHRGTTSAEHFLTKPIDLAALLRLVRAHCEKPAAHRI